VFTVRQNPQCPKHLFRQLCLFDPDFPNKIFSFRERKNAHNKQFISNETFGVSLPPLPSQLFGRETRDSSLRYRETRRVTRVCLHHSICDRGHVQQMPCVVSGENTRRALNPIGIETRKRYQLLA
jgi:hypothetical protein